MVPIRRKPAATSVIHNLNPICTQLPRTPPQETQVSPCSAGVSTKPSFYFKGILGIGTTVALVKYIRPYKYEPRLKMATPNRQHQWLLTNYTRPSSYIPTSDL
ncbi:hypothetical protein YC2023_001043 [Brassica napus]